MIEIQDIYHRPISKPVLTITNSSGYFVYNRATYSIKLSISCDAQKFVTSYNNTILIPNQIIYIRFRGNVKVDTEITIKGVRV